MSAEVPTACGTINLATLLAGTLVVWRLTHMLALEAGPFGVFARMRRWAGAQASAEVQFVVIQPGLAESSSAAGPVAAALPGARHVRVPADRHEAGYVVDRMQPSRAARGGAVRFAVVSADPVGLFTVDADSGEVRLVDAEAWRTTLAPCTLVVEIESSPTGLAGALACFDCLSVWLALPAGMLLGYDSLARVVFWLSFSGGAMLLDRVVAGSHAS